MPFKRYSRRKRSYVKKSYGKKRFAAKKMRIMRKFAKPDGVSSHKFTLTVDVTWVATT